MMKAMVVNNLERSRDEHTIHGRHWTLEQKVNLEQDVGVLNLEDDCNDDFEEGQEEVHLSSGKGSQGEDQQNQHHLSNTVGNRGKLIMTNWLVFLPFIQVSICLKI